MSTRTLHFASLCALAFALAACDIRIETPEHVNDQGDSPEALLINIDSQSLMYVLAEDTEERLDGEAARQEVARILRENPDTQIVIRSDRGASTEAVDGVFTWLRESGVDFGSIIITLAEVP